MKLKPHLSPTISRNTSDIGEYLSQWRRIQHITSAELAQRAGVSRDTISRIEHGDPAVGFGKVLSVCRILGILDHVKESFDPASTEYGRYQLAYTLPERVRK